MRPTNNNESVCRFDRIGKRSRGTIWHLLPPSCELTKQVSNRLHWQVYGSSVVLVRKSPCWTRGEHEGTSEPPHQALLSWWRQRHCRSRRCQNCCWQSCRSCCCRSR